MSFEEAASPRISARYEEEDTSATTPRELNGWYAYTIAAEVFAVVGVGSFLPITLEQLARERGVWFSDRSKPCVETGSPGHAGKIQNRAEAGQKDQCIVNFLGSEITTSSFAMYTFSAAVLVQAITLICLSSFADHGPYRKKMLMTFAYLGSFAISLFILISPTFYFLAPVAVIVGVTCLGCSFSLLNAFLPVLVSHHADSKPGPSVSYHELEALNPGSEDKSSSPEQLARDLERSSRISSKGVGLGYVAAVLVQCFSIGILFAFSKTELAKRNPSLPMRVVLFIAGLWWALFSIPTLLWLRPRPGPPLPSQSRFTVQSRSRTFLFYMEFSLLSFWNTIKRATRLRQTATFLLAWFLLSDAVATLSGVAVLFARTEMKMGTIAIALLSITSIGSGVLGAFAWPRIARLLAISPKQVLLACVVLMELIPLYGILPYIPFIKNAGVGGLQEPWEIYPLGVLHGFIMGGISSYARSVFAPLVPEGREAAFFALYAVTDKGSSAIGPACVGFIVDRTGHIRPAFMLLAVLAVLPAPLLWRLDMEKGRDDAAKMAGEDRKSENSSGDGGEMRERLIVRERED